MCCKYVASIVFCEMGFPGKAFRKVVGRISLIKLLQINELFCVILR